MQEISGGIDLDQIQVNDLEIKMYLLCISLLLRSSILSSGTPSLGLSQQKKLYFLCS